MHYKKVEEYDFRVPSEYKAYLSFRERLKGMGVKFAEQHHRRQIANTLMT